MQNQQRQANASSWSQWGKVAVVFTVATGTYALSKAVGLVWGNSHSTNAPTFPRDTQVPSTTPSLITWLDAQSFTPAKALNLAWQYADNREGQASPFMALSALALSASRYPLISLSTLGLSLMQYFPKVKAVFPATLDLANLTDSEGFVLQGAVGGDQAGYSVSQAGDVNGDGLADVMVGAPYASPLGRSNAGAVYLLFGRNVSWPTLLDLGNLTASQGVVLQGAAAGDITGFSVSAAGDVNGDGLADILIGARDATPVGRTDAGVVYLLFGRNGSWPAVIDLANINVSLGVVMQGVGAYDYMGHSVSAAGDVNGDGLADMLIGARDATPLGRTDAGVVYLLFGRNGSWPVVINLANINASVGVVVQGAVAFDRISASVSAAGDINGDGVADMLVGAYSATPLGRDRAGVAYLIFGHNGSWSANIDLANLNESLGVVLQGAIAFDATSNSVSAAGDINGDGLADILVGANWADPLGRSLAGVAYLLFGHTESWPAAIDLASFNASLGVVLQGAVANDYTGFSVGAAGDVNGDGLADMLIGARDATPLGRTDAGVVYLLFGRNGSWPAVIDLASMNAILGVVLQGAAAGDGTGFSVNAAGDVNGDGLADMLVGAYQADPLNRTDAGATYMIVGQRSLFPNSTLTLPNSTSPAPSAQARHATTGAPTQNSPGFSIYSNTVLYLEIGIETLITTDNLSVEGFTGDPSQLVFRIPESPNYEVTVNGVEQYLFSWGDVGADLVSIRLGDVACFEDFNEIPVQATDGRSTADFNLVFQGEIASCIFSDTSKINAKNSLQGSAMLLVSSGFGIFASKQREKTNNKKTQSKLLKTQNNNNLEMKLSA